jgi:hypothetical protein
MVYKQSIQRDLVIPTSVAVGQSLSSITAGPPLSPAHMQGTDCILTYHLELYYPEFCLPLKIKVTSSFSFIKSLRYHRY